MDTHTAHMRIVLVRPQLGENVGFVARLIKNFAVGELALVAPVSGWRDGALRTASMCPQVVEAAREFDVVADAIADRSRVVGFTARAGSERSVTPLENLESSDGSTALVFGNERTGLSQEESTHCTELVRIDAPGLSSLNLSHAVGLALWEWRRSPPTATEPPVGLASASDKERFIAQATEVLASLGFRVGDPHFAGMVDRLVRGARLQTRDLRMLHRLVTHAAWLRDGGPETTEAR
jgi:tRNA/rRNA methyltransferase